MTTYTEAEIEQHIGARQVPPKARGIYRRALQGGRTAAVKAMCLECQGWEDKAQEAIRDCAARGCPLWAVRPYAVREARRERVFPGLRRTVGERGEGGTE